MVTELNVTRPTLAAKLLNKGYALLRTVPNPWNTQLQTWVFPMNADTAGMTATFYSERGLRVPAAVVEYLKEGDAHEE